MPSAHAPRLQRILSCACIILGVAGCGGVIEVPNLVNLAAPPSTTAADPNAGAGVTATPALAPPAAADSTPPTTGTSGRSAEVPAEPVSPSTSILGSAKSMVELSYASPTPDATVSGLQANARCMRGYAAPASLNRSAPATAPASGGIFYTMSELAVWQQRASSGPFVRSGDFATNSPGDWARIVANAASFSSNGELILGDATSSTITSHGVLARDAAFYTLVSGDKARLPAIQTYLLSQATNAALDFPSVLCITTLSGDTYDAWFAQSGWLLRYVVTYDYLRHSLAAADRLVIENFIRRNAYFLAANNDAILASVFPDRLSGSYTRRDSAAAASTDAAMWWSKRFDTNGDCTVDARDNPTSYVVHTYANADGSPGPRVSVLSQYYNNRRSAAAAALGAAGLLLADPDLITSAKRYFMEWLTYGVWSDGSQGEYARNGDYCIASQGLVYAAFNEQGAGLLALLLARQGDTSMLTFSTIAGLFGTESAVGAPAKSLALVVSTRLKLLTGQLQWFQHAAWRAAQDTSASAALGNTEVHFMGGAQAMDNYHELGLLPLARLLSPLPIEGVVLRDSSVTTLRFPGSTGNPVTTGTGAWTDVFGALPAILLLRPQ